MGPLEVKGPWCRVQEDRLSTLWVQGVSQTQLRHREATAAYASPYQTWQIPPRQGLRPRRCPEGARLLFSMLSGLPLFGPRPPETQLPLLAKACQSPALATEGSILAKGIRSGCQGESQCKLVAP